MVPSIRGFWVGAGFFKKKINYSPLKFEGEHGFKEDESAVPHCEIHEYDDNVSGVCGHCFGIDTIITLDYLK